MLNWLHLTDLHWGLTGQRPLFHNLKHKFYDDLKRLLEISSPWDVIFFTGDFVQSGKKDEFDNLNEEFLEKFDEFLQEQLGYAPVMLAVPGNHDLDRMALDRFPAAAQRLLDLKQLPAVGNLLFEPLKEGEEWKKSEYRNAIDAVFHNYAQWWNAYVDKIWGKNKRRKAKIGGYGNQVSIERPITGLLPGDISTTITCKRTRGKDKKKDYLVGVVGLNTTYLQLAGGDFRGKLSWDPRQLNALCNNDAPDWVGNHDACILMTHQGPAWLTTEARENAMYEINPPGRFAVHLFGHEHELNLESQSTLGGPLRNYWQGSSLFGLEWYGENYAKLDRRHGFSAGRLDPDRCELRIWPRKATLIRGSGWKFLAEPAGSQLSDDESLSQPLSLISNANWQAVNLKQAQDDFRRELRKFLPDDEILIQHLGLDMGEAKDPLLAMLLEPIRARKITVDLLMLSDNPADFKNSPPPVRRWSKDVEASVVQIKKHVESLRKKFEDSGKLLTMRIRPYKETPTIHGFSLVKKRADWQEEQRIATCFAFCRWTTNTSEDGSLEFDWGRERYWKTTLERRDLLAQDMSNIFKGTFEHLWKKSKFKPKVDSVFPWDVTIGVDPAKA